MKTIKASSPCKLIIAGEHAVVYGSPALAVAIKPECSATLHEINGAAGFVICCPTNYQIKSFSNYGETNTKLELTKGKPWVPVIELLKYFKRTYNLKPKKKVELIVTFPPIKGIGASASIASCISKVIFNYMKIKPSYVQLFNAVQALEEVAHGGKASGIDASAVLRGAVRAEKKNGKMRFTKLKKLYLPSGSELIVIDTKLAKLRQGTGKMVKIAALYLQGNVEKLNEFKSLFEQIIKQLKPKGNAQALGKLFNKNHALLASIGVSTKGIELARAVALQNGSYGAKITGAGGEGGAVVALVPKFKSGRIVKALRAKGFMVFLVRFAKVN